MDSQSNISAGIDLSIRIGQRVRHGEYKGQRVTGVVQGLFVQGRELMAEIVLDAPIVIPPHVEGDSPINIHRQHVPAHELAPFDERDELIDEMLAALEAEQEWQGRDAAGQLDAEWDYETMVAAKRRAAIAKATGAQQ